MPKKWSESARNSVQKEIVCLEILSYFAPHFPCHISVTTTLPHLIHNHVKALFMIHLILRDFHEIEHGKRLASESQEKRNEIVFPSCHKLCFSMLMTLFLCRFSVTISFTEFPPFVLIAERSKPNKSIFNYLLLKEINSAARRQRETREQWQKECE